MKHAFLSTGLFASAVTATALSGTAKPTPQPNFIIIIADDMGWEDCGAYGNSNILTPNINQLAKDGMLFERAYLTCSSCSPSRASILTSRYPCNTGAPELHMPLPADQLMVSEVLRNAGYFTAAAGKWHLGPAAFPKFDVAKEAKPNNPSGCDEWIDLLKSRPKDQPFFFWMAAKDPHRPYHQHAPAVNPPASVLIPPHIPDTPAVRADLADYYDEISRLDSYIGQVRQELERQEIADNTLLVFMSDNGRPFPGAKTKLTDDGIRTPFIVVFPGHATPGSHTSSLISSIDVCPTLLDFAGISAPPTFQGKSFRPILTNPSAEIRDRIFAEHDWHDYEAYERGVRDQRFTYIRNWVTDKPLTPPADAVTSPTYQDMVKMNEEGLLTPIQQEIFTVPSPSEFLYDSEKDPHALINLIGNPEYKAVADRLRHELDQWRSSIGDVKPEALTPDKFDRTTGKLIGKLKLGKSVDLVQ